MPQKIVVIGGGPAGMISAGRAGELGAKVILLEKNSQLGVKLLTTGGGRCNLTNNKTNREIADGFGPNGQWLLSALSKVGPERVIDFFKKRGLKTKIEDNDRVFPKSDSAQDVLNVLTNYLELGKVEIMLGAEVKEITRIGNKIQKLVLADGKEIIADKYIICAGGKSYPLTGSTGQGYEWLKQLGHKIIEPKPALTPIILSDAFIKDLEGLSLKDVKIICTAGVKKVCQSIGSLIFTADGISGPAVLNMSKIISQQNLENLQIKLDLFPSLDFPQVDQKLQKAFTADNKIIKSALKKIVLPKFIDTLLSLTAIDPQGKASSITKEERKAIEFLLKDFNLKFGGLAGFDKAMITAGGVDLKEVDSRTMQSKIIENLYLAGEILDLAGPTGGYNLQLCWTTGYLAGENAVQNKG